MQKCVELRATTSELECLWEVVSTVAVALTLLSVPVDKHLKRSWETISAINAAPMLLSILDDRFQCPNGFDMWYKYTNQIYEMRKRAKLCAATSDVEQPWEATFVFVVPLLLTIYNNHIINILYTIYPPSP